MPLFLPSLPSVLWHCWLGSRKGTRPVKNGGRGGGGGHWLVRMEWCLSRWLVCLPLLIFPCTIKSRSSLLALGGPRKRAVKRLWCGGGCFCLQCRDTVGWAVGIRKSIWSVKNECWGASMVVCLEWGTDDLHMVQLMQLPPIISCFIRIQNCLTFLVPAYPGCPGKEAVEHYTLKLCLYVLHLWRLLLC